MPLTASAFPRSACCSEMLPQERGCALVHKALGTALMQEARTHDEVSDGRLQALAGWVSRCPAVSVSHEQIHTSLAHANK